MFPLKDFVSTVVSTTGTSNTREAFPKATVLLMIDCRSKFDVPKSICSWGSISATIQLSGVSSPFSLSLGRFPFDEELIHFSFLDWQPSVKLIARIVIRKRTSVWLTPKTLLRD